jgi:hypothetical protein
MKLRDGAIRLVIDDWVSESQGRAYALRYNHVTYWYGRAIYIVMHTDELLGVNFAVRNTGIGLPAYWPDPYVLRVDHLRQLDADIGACRHEEIISILLAFRRKVE